MDSFDLILPLVGLAIIAAAWAYHLRKRGKADASKSWPAVEGRVTRSEVVAKTEKDSDGDDYVIFVHELAYDYSVGGQIYTGEKVSFASDNRHSKEADAKALAARYPAGSTPKVMANPKNPKEAVLESARPGKTVVIVFTVTGLLFILIGLTA